MSNPVSFKLYLFKRKKKPNGEIPIYLRMTKNGRYNYINTGVAVQENFWNTKGYIKRSHPRSKVLNDDLGHFLDNAKNIQRALPPERRTTKALKNALSSSEHSDFFKYSDQYVNDLYEQRRFWASKHTKVAVNLFREYLRVNVVSFEEIDHHTLEGFQGFLRDQRKNNPNTINKQFQGIKRIFAAAIKDAVTSNDPFRSFKVVSRQRSNKTRLSLEQVKAMEALELDPGSAMFHTRNAFMFSFYNAGIRFSDLCLLKWKNIIDGRMIYQMGKTSTVKNIKLLPPALSIMELYRTDNKEAFIFPFLDKNKNYTDSNFLKRQISSKNVTANANLKRIARLAKIEANISFHVSRHSFADYARSKNMNIYDISKALGHSDITVTQAYLKSFDETSLDSSMEKLFSD